MPRLPSLSNIVTVIIICYVVYSIWSIVQIFVPPGCSQGEKCMKSYLHDKPGLDLVVFSSLKVEPRYDNDVKLVTYIENFSYMEPWEKQLTVDTPKKSRDNGTVQLHVFTVPTSTRPYNKDLNELFQRQDTVYFRIPMTQLHVPDSYIFNLLKDEGIKNDPLKEKKLKENAVKPVTHLKSKVTFNILTDPLELPIYNTPMEIHQRIRVSKSKTFLPLIIYNFLETRTEDLQLMKNASAEFTLKYSPINIGKLRFVLHLETAMVSLKKMGFASKDIDDVKGIFAGTNLYLLSATIIIVSFHLLFDFLAFKNDVKFWRGKSNMEGLSSRTVLWRAFSQAVVFLYLLDEKATVIVLFPSIIATIIEFWKALKVLRHRRSETISETERKTDEYDAESMRYLSYLLYPLCLAGAVYSLLYQPHKSWYSWCIHSLVNGVYAFGFLFMLPQLFVNYRLKSVAALPWRAFMYKAFNTFIDDVFAFIITMPTAHRMACFRDDIIFLIYLYQRWLYPVDKSRVDEAARALGEKPESKKEKYDKSRVDEAARALGEKPESKKEK